jgi:aspartate kinase
VPLLVQKYGGSSLADLDKLRAVAQKIVDTRRKGYDLVVVVSAMGDTTDELLDMAREIAPSPSRRELDMLLSVGERISMTLLSMAIHGHGHQAISLTGSQCGIITTDSHSNARIMDVRPFRVQDEIARGHIVIVAGYQGTSYRREVTTLGRGGSDTTAVALAAALGAEACEIYSDVDGVFSADPRVVLSAEKLVEMSHEEMLEMARSGAKVLNEQAVEFARRSKIALYARSTHVPDSRGTVVRPDGFLERAARAERGRPTVAVSHIDCGIHVRATESADEVIETIGELAVAACDWNEGRCSAFLLTDDLHDADEVRQTLLALGDDVQVADAGLVSVVGHGVGGRPRWARLGRDALRANDVDVTESFITLSRLSWIVPCDDVQAAANALHDELV